MDWNGQSGSLPALSQYGQGRRSTGNPFLDALLSGQPIYSNPPSGNPQSAIQTPQSPTVPNFSDITAKQGPLLEQQAKMEPPNLVGARAKNEADQSNFAKQLAILQAMQTPQMDFQDFQPQTPYPEMQFPGIPQRQTPRVNPLVSALAGLGGMAAPMYAGNLQANASQGAINQSNLQYGDQQTAYNQQLQQLQQHHMDLLNKRNEEIKYAYDNLRGKERAKYLNAIAEREAQLQQVPVQGGLAGAQSEGGALAPGGEISQNTLGHQGIEAQLASLAAQRQTQEEKFKNELEIYKATIGPWGKQGVANTQAGARVQTNQNTNQTKKDIFGGYTDANGNYVKGNSQLHSDSIAQRAQASKDRLEAAKSRAANGSSGNPALRANLAAFNRMSIAALGKLNAAKAMLSNPLLRPADKAKWQQQFDSAEAEVDAVSKQMGDYAATMQTGKTNTPSGLPKGAKVIPLDQFLKGH